MTPPAPQRPLLSGRHPVIPRVPFPRLAQELFELVATRVYPDLEACKRETALLRELWALIARAKSSLEPWARTPWAHLQLLYYGLSAAPAATSAPSSPGRSAAAAMSASLLAALLRDVTPLETMERELAALGTRLAAYGPPVSEWGALQVFAGRVEAFRAALPWARRLLHPAVRARHWRALMRLTGRRLVLDPPPSLCGADGKALALAVAEPPVPSAASAAVARAPSAPEEKGECGTDDGSSSTCRLGATSEGDTFPGAPPGRPLAAVKTSPAPGHWRRWRSRSAAARQGPRGARRVEDAEHGVDGVAGNLFGFTLGDVVAMQLPAYASDVLPLIERARLERGTEAQITEVCAVPLAFPHAYVSASPCVHPYSALFLPPMQIEERWATCPCRLVPLLAEGPPPVADDVRHGLDERAAARLLAALATDQVCASP